MRLPESGTWAVEGPGDMAEEGGWRVRDGGTLTSGAPQIEVPKVISSSIVVSRRARRRIVGPSSRKPAFAGSKQSRRCRAKVIRGVQRLRH